MKIVLVHRYFWPTPYPYAAMLRDIAERMVAEGHEVTVIAPADEDRDRDRRLGWASERGVSVVQRVAPNRRAASRTTKVRDYVAYLKWLRGSLASTDGDIYWVATTPPVLAAREVRRHARREGAGFVYHCQDIHPEASSRLGSLSPWLARILRAIDRRNVADAARVIVLSEDMKASLAARGNKVEHVRVINNYLREELARPAVHTATPVTPGTTDASADGGRRPSWIFAGSLGHFQNLELLLAGFLLVDESLRPDLVFLGDGPVRTRLEDMVAAAGASRVTFAGTVSPEEAQRRLQEHDVGIVSLARGIIDFAYPSKTITYLGAGLKVLCLVERRSSLAEMIAAEQVGWVSEAGDARALAEDMQRFLDDPTMRERERARVKDIAEREFGASRVLDQYARLLPGSAS